MPVFSEKKIFLNPFSRNNFKKGKNLGVGQKYEFILYYFN